MTIEELTTLENLNDAFYKCSKISNWKESTQRYKSNLLLNNLKLQNDLRTNNYKVSPTTDFILNERGKTRQINAPSIRDRIVQKILCEKILVPQLTKYIIYDNYASIKNRGTTFARKRFNILLNNFVNQHGTNGYILQIDIKKYFDSINHEILKDIIHNKIHEPKEIMDLIDYIIDTSSKTDKGLNLGAEAPQIFAIYYLAQLDNYIKSVKQVKYYGRYMDDMFILSESKQELHNILNDIKNQLKTLDLQTNPKKTHITKLTHCFTFLQIKYFIDTNNNNKIIKRPTHAKITRERRHLKQLYKKYINNQISLEYVNSCYQSWRGSIAKDCNSYNKTIYHMDKLYNTLFPEYKKQTNKSRNELISNIFNNNFDSFLDYVCR